MAAEAEGRVEVVVAVEAMVVAWKAVEKWVDSSVVEAAAVTEGGAAD